jgi:hypothetical protein
MSGQLCYGLSIPIPGGSPIPAPLPISANGQSVPVSATDAFALQPWQSAFLTALGVDLLVKDAPSTLGFLRGRIDAGSATTDYFIQVWNQASVPPDGTTVDLSNSLMAPVKFSHVAGTDTPIEIQTPGGGIEALIGIAVGLSEKEFSKASAGQMSLTVTFRDLL